jgi:endonuclease/exonuclease/phosphatase family metal-dependent hydrolase
MPPVQTGVTLARMRRVGAPLPGLALFLLAFLLTAPARAAELRVVTFNMAMGQFFGGFLDGLIRDTFAEHDRLRGFDVIGLQEACKNDRQPIELLRGVMKRAHGRVYEHSVLADPKSKESCRKAQVILSRYPIVQAGGLTLPKVGAKRAAAWADLQIGSKTLRVYNLHLSNRRGMDLMPTRGRWAQARVVLEHWLETKRKDPHARGIVLGDFNSIGNLWTPTWREQTIVMFSHHMKPSLVGFIPTMWLPYETDWIFSSGLRIRRSYVIPTVYSDHYVVMADYVF